MMTDDLIAIVAADSQERVFVPRDVVGSLADRGTEDPGYKSRGSRRWLSAAEMAELRVALERAQTLSPSEAFGLALDLICYASSTKTGVALETSRPGRSGRD